MRITPVALAAAFAFSASAAPPPEQQTSLMLTHRTGCDDLPGRCYGGGTKLGLAFPAGSGQWIFSLGKFTTGNARFHIHTGAEGKLAAASLDITGRLEGTGIGATLDRTFSGDSIGAQVGVYAAHVKARGSVEGTASATLKAQPDIVISVPSITLGRHTIPGRTITIPVPERTASIPDAYEKDAAGAYGGFRGDLRYGMRLNDSFALGATLYGRVGADLVRAGGGVELLWSSAPDSRLAARPGGPFVGTALTSTARYAFGVGLWREQDTHNELYRAERRGTQRLVDRYKTEIADIQSGVDQAIDKVYGQLPSQIADRIERPASPNIASYLPSYSATYLLDKAHVYDPSIPRYAVSLRGVARITENTHVSLTVLKPIGSNAHTGTRIEAAARYDF